MPTIYGTALRAYTTRAYSVTDFAAVLVFGGLPDVVLAPNDTTPMSVNLTQYAWHASLPVTALNYALLFVTDPRVSARMVTTGVLEIAAPALWMGQAEVFVRAGDGTHTAVDSFLVTRNTVPFQSYLPLVIR